MVKQPTPAQVKAAKLSAWAIKNKPTSARLLLAYHCAMAGRL